ncbi:hypothetical protein BH23ACT6_BH23ACT6_08790 [soil metagenome]
MRESAAQRDADVIIIGAGVIGSALAYELSRRGMETVNVDALPAAGYGSTSYSSAIIRFSYSTPHGVTMAWEAMHYWRDWAAYLGVDRKDTDATADADGTGSATGDAEPLAELVTCGMALLDIGSGFAAKVRTLFEQLDIPHEQWDAEQLGQRIPLLDTSRVGPPCRVDDEAFWAEPTGTLAGALWMPDAGYVNDPQLAARNLHHAALRAGARFQFETRVSGVERRDGRTTGVLTQEGTVLRAPVVVNVAGPDSARVNALAGLTGSMAIATRPMRQEVHHLPSPIGADGEPLQHVVADEDSGIYFKPETGAMIAIGSMEPACDELEWLDSPDDYRPVVSAEQWERQTLRLARRIPTLRIPNRPLGIVGIYDVSDDWIPIYDKTDLGGFYVAIGSSGNQFKNAPFVAHAMTELILAVESGHDHDRDPIQVSGPHTGRSMDLGRYSRNRQLDPNSSFSVLG